jgi:hypothetical protein
MFHLLNYRVVAGVNDVNVDETMTTDTIYTARNGHLLLTEPMNLIGAMHLAVSALRVRTNIPSWNNLGRHQIWPVNRSATPPSYPRIDDYRGFPKTLPMNEEIAFEESNNLGAATEETTTTLWIAPPDWTINTPRGMPFGEGLGQAQLTVRATAAVTRVAAAWANGAITLADTLKGGWYAVVGAYCFDANLRLFRLIFPQTVSRYRRNFRPGSYVSNATGNLETPGSNDFFNENLGLWGVFSTLELPLLEVYADAAGASTQELRLNLIYLGGGGNTTPPLGGYL